MRALRWLTDFPNLTAFFSVKGFVVSFVVMLLTAVAFRLLRRLWRLMRRHLVGTGQATSDPSGALAAYVRLVRVLADYGLSRPPTETPREFARRAADPAGRPRPRRPGPPPGRPARPGSSRPSTASVTVPCRWPTRRSSARRPARRPGGRAPAASRLIGGPGAIGGRSGRRADGLQQQRSARCASSSDSDREQGVPVRCKRGWSVSPGAARAPSSSCSRGPPPTRARSATARSASPTLSDPRLDALAAMFAPKKITRASVEILDTPGLMPGSHGDNPQRPRPDPQGGRPRRSSSTASARAATRPPTSPRSATSWSSPTWASDQPHPRRWRRASRSPGPTATP